MKLNAITAALSVLLALLTATARGATSAALAAENITVLVIDEATTNPVPGAVVTLRGTDPASAGGLVLTTGAGGTVDFVGVSGPYSVTAQMDVNDGGVTTRVAVSLVDIAPVVSGAPLAGSIGLFIELPSPGPPPPTVTLSGTIAGLPVLTGAQLIEVVAVDRADGSNVGWGFGSTGSYTMSIPPNTVVDCYVAHRATTGSAPVLASLITTGVGPFAPFATPTLNFNFAGAAPWTTTVNISETGRAPGLWMGLQLLVRNGSGVDLDFSFWDASSGPSTINLPDVTHPNLSGFRVDLEADTYDPFQVVFGGQDRSYLLSTTPTNVLFDFMPLPTPVQPLAGAVLSPSELANLAVSFVQGAPPAGFGSNGINGFFLESDEDDPCPAPAGIDNASWNVLVSGGSQSFTMPPASLPMFTTGQDLYAGFFQFRVKGYPVSFAGFFDANLAANLSALDASTTEEVGSELVFGFSLGADTYCTAGASASGCQALLSTAGSASATAPSGFDVLAVNVEGNKSGILFFGTNGRQANPWGTSSSYQCVAPPVRRTGLLAPSGTNNNCDGAYAKDMNAHWTSKPAQNPGLGATVQLQLWFRDPVNTSNQTTSLSNALEFCVGF